jgi:hypothetical protein
MRATFVITAVALLVSVAPVSASVATPPTGLRGTVTRGPVTPVCRTGVPCTAPAKHVTVTFTRNGVSKTVVTGDEGRYSIALAAGTYGVRIGPLLHVTFTPRTAVVTAGRMTNRNFSIDTGIR